MQVATSDVYDISSEKLFDHLLPKLLHLSIARVRL